MLIESCSSGLIPSTDPCRWGNMNMQRLGSVPYWDHSKRILTRGLSNIPLAFPTAESGEQPSFSQCHSPKELTEKVQASLIPKRETCATNLSCKNTPISASFWPQLPGIWYFEKSGAAIRAQSLERLLDELCRKDLPGCMGFSLRQHIK